MTISMHFDERHDRARLDFETTSATEFYVTCDELPDISVGVDATGAITTIAVRNARTNLPAECLRPSTEANAFTYARSIDMAYVALVDIPPAGVSTTVGCFGLPGGRVMNIDLDPRGRILGLEFDAALGLLTRGVLDRASSL
jgi:hypothetical protein